MFSASVSASSGHSSASASASSSDSGSSSSSSGLATSEGPAAGDGVGRHCGCPHGTLGRPCGSPGALTQVAGRGRAQQGQGEEQAGPHGAGGCGDTEGLGGPPWPGAVWPRGTAPETGDPRLPRCHPTNLVPRTTPTVPVPVPPRVPPTPGIPSTTPVPCPKPFVPLTPLCPWPPPPWGHPIPHVPMPPLPPLTPQPPHNLPIPLCPAAPLSTLPQGHPQPHAARAPTSPRPFHGALQSPRACPRAAAPSPSPLLRAAAPPCCPRPRPRSSPGGWGSSACRGPYRGAGATCPPQPCATPAPAPSHQPPAALPRGDTGGDRGGRGHVGRLPEAASSPGGRGAPQRPVPAVGHRTTTLGAPRAPCPRGPRSEPACPQGKALLHTLGLLWGHGRPPRWCRLAGFRQGFPYVSRSILLDKMPRGQLGTAQCRGAAACRGG